MTDNTLNNARHEVLADNTAQDVHKYLTKLFQEETRFRSRWIWELLQNARDASPDQGVHVYVIQEPDRPIFRHNGNPFTSRNIAHLIYHGSTKRDLIGQFGTGFLTTHLISKTVAVLGKTSDGTQFSFLLDRRGSNADELKGAMDSSWEAFISSLTQKIADRPTDGFTTEYAYPLVSDILGVVSEGIADLITNAGYVLAFNSRIRSLHVKQPDRSVTIEKKDQKQLSELVQLLDVEERVLGNDSVILLFARPSQAHFPPIVSSCQTSGGITPSRSTSFRSREQMRNTSRIARL